MTLQSGSSTAIGVQLTRRFSVAAARHLVVELPYRPSERVSSTGRKLPVINDPLVKSSDAGTIECARCGAKVPGSVGQDYDLRAWEEHKAQCR